MTAYIGMNKEVEFINRTRKIVAQYSSLETSLGVEYFDVTLLLNCLLGLIVLPREWKINQIEDIPIPDEITNTLISSTINNENISISFKEYIVALRNGIVHFGQDDSLDFVKENGLISAVTILGSSRNQRAKHKFKFNLKNGNELKLVINKILDVLDILHMTS